MLKKPLRFIIIGIITLLLIAGVTIMLLAKNDQLPEFIANNPIVKGATCTQLYHEIDQELKNANYCETDADCDSIMLGGRYVAFGCSHYVNKSLDQEAMYDKMDIYEEKCDQMINDCVIPATPSCVAGKCVYYDVYECGNFPTLEGDGGPTSRYYVCRDAHTGDCSYQKTYSQIIEGCDPEFDAETNPYGNPECFDTLADVYSPEGELLLAKSKNLPSVTAYPLASTDLNCVPTSQAFFETKTNP